MMRHCYECKTTSDLRPYGPSGADVCFRCAMATPERKAQTERALDAQFAAAEQVGGVVVIGTDLGPYPATTKGAIIAFKDEYRWLSNFWHAPVLLDGDTYSTVEHAYQAAKTLDLEERRSFQHHAMTPSSAKRHGRIVTLRPDWDRVRQTVMLDLTRQKYQRPYLRAKLLNTGNRKIIEGNNWHDNFWGRCSCRRCIGKGQNTLGQILMQVRREQRAGETTP